MAIIEIAKIQVRRGQENQTGVPILDGGEFAWAADTENLYIGLRREDGGSRDANIRVLTENDLRNFFDVDPVNSSTYIYKVESDITNNGVTEFARNVQAGLDDGPVSLKAFGDVGSGGISDDTAILQRAIDNLFNNSLELDQDPHTTLLLPAGTYNISSAILVPANTTIIGDGKEKTIINLKNVGEHAFRSAGRIDPSDIVPKVFDSSTMTFYGSYPNNIRIENLTIQYDVDSSTVTNALPLLELGASRNSIIRDVKFKGHYSVETVGITTNTYCGIDIREFDDVTEKNNLLIENCNFEGLQHGIICNYDADNMIIKDSKFFTCGRGITFNDPPDVNSKYGPMYAKIENNTFDQINSEAIYVGMGNISTGTRHISQNNTFLNVGNSLFDEGYTTATSVIRFATDENASIDDVFQRYQLQSAKKGASEVYNPLILGRSTIDNSFVSTATISGNSTIDTIVRFPITQYPQHLNIKYSIFDTPSGIGRMGNLSIFLQAGSNPNSIVEDYFTFIGDDTASGTIAWTCTVDESYSYYEVKAAKVQPGSVIIEYQSKLMI